MKTNLKELIAISEQQNEVIQEAEELLHKFGIPAEVWFSSSEGSVCIGFRQISKEWTLYFGKGEDFLPLISVSRVRKTDALLNFGSLLEKIVDINNSNLDRMKRSIEHVKECISDSITEL